MADLFFPEVPVNQRATALGLEIMPATFGEGFGAAFEETLTRNPIPSAFRATARARYRDGAYVDEFGNEQTAGRIPSNILSSEEASSKYGLQGRLKFDAPTPEPIAESLYRLKVRELELQDTKRRANAGLGTGLTAGILGSLLDPLNLALAFVPIVGPARQAALATRLGVGGGRAATGAVEGAVGAAIIEPLVLGVAREEQADYTAVDSLANIVFGTAIGGGLHFSAGYIGDRFKARAEASPLAKTIDNLPHQDQAALLRTAVAQALDGRPIDMRAMIEVATRSSDLAGLERARENNTFTGQAPGAGQSVGLTQPKGTPPEKLFSNFADQEKPEALPAFRSKMFDRANASPKAFANDLVDTTTMPFADGLTVQIDAAKRGGTRVQVLDGGAVVAAAQVQKGLLDSVAVTESAKGRNIGENFIRFLRDERIANVEEVPDRSPGFVRAQKKVLSEPAKEVASALQTETAAKEAVAKAQEPHIDKADSDGAAVAEQRLAEEANIKSIDDEATRMQEEVAELEAYSPEGIEPSQAVKDAAKEASLYARAWQAAAACGMRKA